MANKSKTKGNSFERSLVETLNRVFGLNFQRVPNSGAFTGGKNIHRSSTMTESQKLLHDGDIIVPEELSHLSIEAKNYAEFPFHALFTGKCGQLDTWVEQAGHTIKPFWLLFFKITHKNVYVCHSKEYKLVTKDNTMLYQDKYFIELAEPFLMNNKNHLLELKNTDIFGESREL